MPSRLRLATRIGSIMTILLAASQSREATADDAAIIADLKQVITQQMADKELPCISIALVRDGEVVWSSGFGVADAESGRNASDRTVYRVGSISKLLTDLAVMRQVEAGKLDLDKPVQRYVPQLKGTKKQLPGITLRRLMSHRSGIVREPAVGHYFDHTNPGLVATVESLRDSQPVYKPGERTKYSNAAIAIVGLALQDSLGIDFDAAIRQQMLEPLGMKTAGFDSSEVPDELECRGIMWTVDGREFPAPDFKLGTSPAGNLYASVLDLSKVLQFIMSGGVSLEGRLLEPGTISSMFEPQQDNGRPKNTFGLGFHVGELDGHRRLGHGGAVYGFSTELAFLPDQNMGVAVACGMDMTNGIVERIADHALQLMLADQKGAELPGFQGSVPLPSGLSRTIHGEFVSTSGRKVELLPRGDRLRARIGSLMREVRAAEGGFVVDDRFGYGPELERINSSEIRIDGKLYLRGIPVPPPVPRTELSGVIGEYGWPHNTLYILEDNGQLFALIEWFFFYPLKQVGPDRFAFPDYGLYHGEEILFERDEKQRVKGARTAGVWFPTIPLPGNGAESFKVDLVKPIKELREIAAGATPPEESDDLREPDFTELTRLKPSIKLDIRYAGSNNFMGAPFYSQPRAFMQRPAAEAVAAVHQRLKSAGYGLLIHDAYRPWYVTKMFYDGTPDSMKDFVADPSKGSRHNRGCAVDLTLYSLKTGQPIQMVSGYDEFTPRAFPDYPGGTDSQRWHRELLRRAMEDGGFSVYEFEWWHFDFHQWREYGINNVLFEDIPEK